MNLLAIFADVSMPYGWQQQINNFFKPMKRPLISVIVPIYKVEPYLKICIDSILSQTYRQLEIILVDDGSPDSCGEMCDRYARQDPRIRVIHQANGGLSCARNAGLEVATGEFISFIDSDDYIVPYMYEDLIQGFSTFENVGVVSSCYYNLENNRLFHQPEKGTYQSAFRIKHDTILQEMLVENKINVQVWNKLYHRKAVEGLRFAEGINAEDYLYMLHLSERLAALKLDMVVIPAYHYCYRMHSHSITNDASKPLGLSMCKILPMMMERTEEGEVKQWLRYRYNWATMLLYLHLLENRSVISDETWKEGMAHAKRLKTLSFEEVKPATDSWDWKSPWIFNLLKYCPCMYQFLYRIHKWASTSYHSLKRRK